MQTLDLPRRRGRPKLEWTHEIFKVIGRIFDTHDAFRLCVANEMEWRDRIRRFSRALPGR